MLSGMYWVKGTVLVAAKVTWAVLGIVVCLILVCVILLITLLINPNVRRVARY